VVFRLGHHHAVDQDPGDDDITGIERAAVGKPFYLDDHDPAGVPGSLRHGERIEDHGFFFHGDVAVRVRRRTSQEGHMDGEGLVEEIVLAIDIHHRDKIFSLCFGKFVELAAIDPGIDKGAETDMGQISRFAGGDVSIELGHSSHRNVVGENLVVEDQFPQPRGKTRMAADESSHQAFKGKVIQPLSFPVPLSRRIRQRQISRPAGFQEPLFESDGKFLRESCPDKACRHNRVVVADKIYGLFSRDDFPLLHMHG